VEQSKLLQKLLGVKAHFVSLPKGNKGEATRIVFHRKVEAHMAYQARTASMEVGEFRFLHRRVKVKMQPTKDDKASSSRHPAPSNTPPSTENFSDLLLVTVDNSSTLLFPYFLAPTLV
jgi:hypothetical protein